MKDRKNTFYLKVNLTETHDETCDSPSKPVESDRTDKLRKYIVIVYETDTFYHLFF
jgi:hypothetical protein